MKDFQSHIGRWGKNRQDVLARGLQVLHPRVRADQRWQACHLAWFSLVFIHAEPLLRFKRF